MAKEKDVKIESVKQHYIPYPIKDELIGMNMKRLETDVVIFGGGTAGLAAAVTAAERGARVIVLEK
ncbi:MAG: FAD-binding protein, partial [Candidatus Bathyarchaeia archaeon]